jgi:anaerobic ribonucleoside-triphosphate reductase activating protein
MRIAGTNSCSLVNGEGIRYVIFLQGCQHFCPGCHNPDTWDFESGEEIPVEKLAADIFFRRYIDGITLSGGDPFYQQEECIKLLDLLPGINVWIYTGFEFDEIKDTKLAKRADVLVTGPFVEELKCEGKMYGSSNQEIHRRKNENNRTGND